MMKLLQFLERFQTPQRPARCSSLCLYVNLTHPYFSVIQPQFSHAKTSLTLSNEAQHYPFSIWPVSYHLISSFRPDGSSALAGEGLIQFEPTSVTLLTRPLPNMVVEKTWRYRIIRLERVGQKAGCAFRTAIALPAFERVSHCRKLVHTKFLPQVEVFYSAKGSLGGFVKFHHIEASAYLVVPCIVGALAIIFGHVIPNNNLGVFECFSQVPGHAFLLFVPSMREKDTSKGWMTYH